MSAIYSDEDSLLLVNDASRPGREGKKGRQSVFFGFAFTVNWIVGAGLFNLPFAFYSAGWVTGLVLLVFVTMLSTLTTVWLVECIGRTEAWVSANEAKGSFTDGDMFFGPAPQFAARNRKFEVVEMVEIFYGKKFKIFYQVGVVCFIFGAMWLYAALFADSMTASVPAFGWTTGHECVDVTNLTGKCLDAYYLYVGVYALVMTPLLLLDLSGQIFVQLGLTVVMIIFILVMIFTVVAGLVTETYCDKSHTSHPALKAPYTQPVKAFDLSGFGELFTTAIFSVLCQQGVPAFMQLIPDKKKAPATFASALVTVCVLYCVVSVLTVLYFGEYIQTPVTLNWVDFGQAHIGGKTSWIGLVISYITTIFPVISVSAAFPLNVHSLVDTVQSIFPAPYDKKKSVSIALRLGTAYLACFLAAVVRSVSSIIVIPGLFGFLLMFIMPALLQLRSKARCRERFGEDRTPYSRRFVSSDALAYAVLAFSAVGLAFSLYSVIHSYADPPPHGKRPDCPHSNAVTREVMWGSEVCQLGDLAFGM